MSQLIILVLDDPGKTGNVLDAWLAAGISGVTMLDSTGLARQMRKRELRDDLPLFPSLESLLQGREERHCTLFAVVPDGFDVEALVKATEKVTGTLDEPSTGILFVVPIKQVWGLRRQQ